MNGKLPDKGDRERARSFLNDMQNAARIKACRQFTTRVDQDCSFEFLKDYPDSRGALILAMRQLFNTAYEVQNIYATQDIETRTTRHTNAKSQLSHLLKHHHYCSDGTAADLIVDDLMQHVNTVIIESKATDAQIQYEKNLKPAPKVIKSSSGTFNIRTGISQAELDVSDAKAYDDAIGEFSRQLSSLHVLIDLNSNLEKMRERLSAVYRSSEFLAAEVLGLADIEIHQRYERFLASPSTSSEELRKPVDALQDSLFTPYGNARQGRFDKVRKSANKDGTMGYARAVAMLSYQDIAAKQAVIEVMRDVKRQPSLTLGNPDLLNGYLAGALSREMKPFNEFVDDMVEHHLLSPGDKVKTQHNQYRISCLLRDFVTQHVELQRDNGRNL